MEFSCDIGYQNNFGMLLVTNIQRFSLHDGPGIRTTVFLKGCSIRCPWCCNPENLNPYPEPYVKNGEVGIYGIYMTCDEIFNEVIKDKGFYGNGREELDEMPGGVTFSGGEALLYAVQLEPLMERLKDEYIHMGMETCLFAPTEKLKLAMRYIDLFYADIKIMDSRLCKKIAHGNLDLYLKNLDVLMKSGLPTVIRIPVIARYTDGEENRQEIVKILEKYKPLKVELIEGHNLGVSKYRSLSLPVPNYKAVCDDLMERYKCEIEGIGISVEVCKI